MATDFDHENDRPLRFFDLPRELRNMIYGYLTRDLQPPRYNEVTPRITASNYVRTGLRLISRQFMSEYEDEVLRGTSMCIVAESLDLYEGLHVTIDASGLASSRHMDQVKDVTLLVLGDCASEIVPWVMDGTAKKELQDVVDCLLQSRAIGMKSLRILLCFVRLDEWENDLTADCASRWLGLDLVTTGHCRLTMRLLAGGALYSVDRAQASIYKPMQHAGDNKIIYEFKSTSAAGHGWDNVELGTLQESDIDIDAVVSVLEAREQSWDDYLAREAPDDNEISEWDSEDEGSEEA